MPSPATALRGDDALARAAAGVAAPARRLLLALRDAHAETFLRIATLRRCDAALASRGSPLQPALARLLGEAEEQHRRLQILFAWLRERPGGGLVPTDHDPAALLASAGEAAEMLRRLEAAERSGAEETQRLRDLAWMAGQNLAARLLDLTADEREAAARTLQGLLAATRH